MPNRTVQRGKMTSFFARHGLSKFSNLLDELGVDTPDDLKLVDVDDLTAEGMQQGAAENLVTQIQQIIEKENIGSDEKTETDDGETCGEEETEEHEEAYDSAVSVPNGHINKSLVSDLSRYFRLFVNISNVISRPSFDLLDSHSSQRSVPSTGTSYWSCMCAHVYQFGQSHLPLFVCAIVNAADA